MEGSGPDYETLNQRCDLALLCRWSDFEVHDHAFASTIDDVHGEYDLRVLIQ